ncbi:thymidine phosphorylase [Pseudomonas sp. NZIPFR-PS5]|nr:thymidine phosphorylase [Pseudomonas sp. NZIPFR-PS5]
MQNDGNKVVPLKAGADHPGSSPVARLPVVLLQVRDRAAQQLKESLQTLFDNADDTLFEMADRAHNNAEQNIFFEAMRDLRLKRKSIERNFLDKFFEAFLRLGQYEVAEPPMPEPVSYDKLALVHNDDLERTVAVDAMVVKVMSRDGIALGQLTTRLNVLIPQPLTDETNPLGPTLLCDYFLQAGRSLGVEIKVKLIILKLFEKYALSNADQLYEEANQLLISAGVLPELKALPSRRSTDRIASVPPSSEALRADNAAILQATESLDKSVQDVFSALQELLVHVRGHLTPRPESVTDARPISSQDLLRLLSHLQQYVPKAEESDDFDLRAQLEQLISRVSARSGKFRVVGTMDEDVINLISMLFEFILDDRNLPSSLRALIGRLQIPMLKVAVIDKSFFSRGSHPARRLLNEIASAALGWGGRDDTQRDSLYARIDQIVQRLLHDFVDDPAIFTELLVDFLAFTSDERRRSELLEQRTRDAEQGRALAELARQRVQQALNDRLLGKTLPQVVVRLLQEAWSKVLLLTCLKHGDQSVEWTSGLQAMDDLIWSVESHDEPEARQRLLELVPGLLKSLRDGLSSAAFDPFATSEFFSQLEALHVQAFSHVTKAPGTTTVGDQVASDHGPTMMAVVEEIVLVGPGEQIQTEPSMQLPADDEGLMQVEKLRLGSWVEIQEDESHKLRCKLAAIVDPSGRYVFVNRTGMKVLEKTRMGLAVEFRRGAIRVLDDALLFDRALESVLGNLRKLKG